VSKAVEEYKRTSQSQKAPSSKGAQSVTSNKDLAERNANDDKRSQAPSQVSQKSQAKSQVSRSSKNSNSETSSLASKSVYQVDGDDDDEWATLVKFDTELFKKEKELERMRE
jgi:hypothetical protein